MLFFYCSFGFHILCSHQMRSYSELGNAFFTCFHLIFSSFVVAVKVDSNLAAWSNCEDSLDGETLVPYQCVLRREDTVIDGFRCSEVVFACPTEQSCRPGLGTGACSLPRGQGHDMAMGVIPCHSQSFRHSLSGVPLAEDCLPPCQWWLRGPRCSWRRGTKVCFRWSGQLAGKVWVKRMMNQCCIGIKFHDQKEKLFSSIFFYFLFKDFANIWALAGAIAGSQRTQVGGAQHFPGFGGQGSFEFWFKHFRTKVNSRYMSILCRYSISSSTWGLASQFGSFRIGWHPETLIIFGRKRKKSRNRGTYAVPRLLLSADRFASIDHNTSSCNSAESSFLPETWYNKSKYSSKDVQRSSQLTSV